MDEEDEYFLSASHRKCILLSGTECHIINYLLTELAGAVPGNIGPRLFSYGPRCARSVLSRPWANITQYGPRAWLVRGYYYMANPVLGKSLCSDWFFLGQDFAARTVCMETVQSVYFCFGAKPANSTFATKTKKKGENCHSSH